MNRRTILKTGLALFPVQALLARAQAFFPEPPLRPVKRREGVVEARLEAVAKPIQVGGKTAELWTYGGSLPGPTLRLKEGERLRLVFRNRLGEVTNLHFHGLPIPPLVDNPFLEIPPGEEQVYEFTVPRGAAGTYWYHPHVHGKVANQLFRGLAGTIVVEGPLDALPELRAAEEHLIVLKDLELLGGKVAPHTPMDWMNGKEGSLVLANGALRPTLRPGKGLLRLRLLNASNARFYRLALEGHTLVQIATDGGFLAKPVELEELLLAPGERAEVLVALKGAGEYRLLALPYDRGAIGMMDMGGMRHMMGTGPSRTEHLLTITVPKAFPKLPLPKTLAGLKPLSPSGPLRRLVLSENMMAGEFFINGRKFDHTRVDLRAQRGQVEVWEVENQGDMDHPFHLHTHPFQVLARNGRPEPFPAWKDTVNIRAGEVVRLAVAVGFPGKTVFHCHIVEHEDQGMMGVLEVQ